VAKEPEATRPSATSTTSSSGGYFCLDCESCASSTCGHTTHSRRFFADFPALAEHSQRSGHRQSQPAANFLQMGRHVRLADVAYSHVYGDKVRKHFKKMVLANRLEVGADANIKCKVRGCNFEASYIFSHIRDEHLNK
jgi:hypothetical protein